MDEYIPEQTSVDEINQEQVGEVPVGAKIISGLYYLNVAASLVTYILIMINLIKNRIIPTGNFPVLTIVFGTLSSIVLIILFLSIAKGLWNGKGWARITAVLFSIIALVFYIIILAIGSVIFAVVGFNSQQMLLSILKIILIIGINAFIVGYLLFSKKVNEAFRENIPVGVQMISVWCFFGAVIFGLLGIVSIIGRGIMSGLLFGTESTGTGIFIVVDVLIFGVGLLNFFIGRGLWRAKNWAKIITIIFAILGILGGIYAIISSFTSGASLDFGAYSSILQTYQIFGGVMLLLLYGVIAGYLLFNGKVKEVFNKKAE